MTNLSTHHTQLALNNKSLTYLCVSTRTMAASTSTIFMMLTAWLSGLEPIGAPYYILHCYMPLRAHFTKCKSGIILWLDPRRSSFLMGEVPPDKSKCPNFPTQGFSLREF